ncbi:MAG: sugar ABC transporter permease [Gemmatimonadetes bacterium]|nr:sugar ABC transporter permease [Gemmatimonadota bacterium]
MNKRDTTLGGASAVSGPSPRAGWAFVAFPLTVIFVFTALPTLACVGLSFFDWSGGGVPRFVGLENYRAALTRDPQLWLALRNTLVFAIGTVPVTVVLGFLVAVALHARWFRGKAAACTMFFLPTVMSIVAVGFVWQWMLNPRAGLLKVLLGTSGGDLPEFLGDTWLGLGTLIFVQIWRNLGFGVVLYLVALSRVPKSIYDAASVDGAGPWHTTWRITWPTVRPMTAFLLITGAIWALQVFELDLVMTGWSPQRFNDMLNTHIFREFKNGRLGYSATVGVVLLSMIAAITYAQFRWLRAGSGGEA